MNINIRLCTFINLFNMFFIIGITQNVGSDGEMSSIALKGVGDSSGRPKRYSSLRQRSLPESSSYQTTQQAVPTQHASYYETGGYI